MHSISDSTEKKKGQNWLLLPLYDRHGSQQQGKTGLERAIPARALCSETHSNWVGVRLVYDDRWTTKHLNKIKGSVGRLWSEVPLPFLSTKSQGTTSEHRAFCTAQGISLSPIWASSRGPKLRSFPPNKREKQNTLDVDYGINRRNSAATYTERNLKIL